MSITGLIAQMDLGVSANGTRGLCKNMPRVEYRVEGLINPNPRYIRCSQNRNKTRSERREQKRPDSLQIVLSGMIRASEATPNQRTLILGRVGLWLTHEHKNHIF